MIESVTASCLRCSEHTDSSKPCQKILAMQAKVEKITGIDLCWVLEGIVDLRSNLEKKEKREDCMYSCDEFMALCLDFMTSSNNMPHTFMPYYEQGTPIPDEADEVESMMQAFLEFNSKENGERSTTPKRCRELREKYNKKLQKETTEERKKINKEVLHIISCTQRMVSLRSTVLNKVRGEVKELIELLAHDNGDFKPNLSRLNLSDCVVYIKYYMKISCSIQNARQEKEEVGDA